MNCRHPLYSWDGSGCLPFAVAQRSRKFPMTRPSMTPNRHARPRRILILTATVLAAGFLLLAATAHAQTAPSTTTVYRSDNGVLQGTQQVVTGSAWGLHKDITLPAGALNNAWSATLGIYGQNTGCTGGNDQSLLLTVNGGYGVGNNG